MNLLLVKRTVLPYSSRRGGQMNYFLIQTELYAERGPPESESKIGDTCCGWYQGEWQCRFENATWCFAAACRGGTHSDGWRVVPSFHNVWQRTVYSDHRYGRQLFALLDKARLTQRDTGGKCLWQSFVKSVHRENEPSEEIHRWFSIE